MEAATLHCPACGAAASNDSTACEHCGARLATVSCASCFGMIFLGAKFCAHCGARVGKLEDEDAAREKPCPHCRVALQSVTLGSVKMRACGKCDGLWVDVETFNSICNDKEQQAAVLGGAAPPPERLELTLEPVRYLRCPECDTLMNRVNFADRSGVIVDSCRGHGTWFDRDELQHIVEFIRGGGLAAARQRDLDSLKTAKSDRHFRKRAESSAAGSIPLFDWGSGSDLVDVLVVVGRALRRLFVP